MNAVFYRADHTIVSSMRGSESAIEKTAQALGMSYLETEEYRNDYDRTHTVVNGALVEKTDA